MPAGRSAPAVRFGQMPSGQSAAPARFGQMPAARLAPALGGSTGRAYRGRAFGAGGSGALRTNGVRAAGGGRKRGRAAAPRVVCRGAAVGTGSGPFGPASGTVALRGRV